MKKAIYKIPNGKLLKISLEDNDGKIVRVKIAGDFFAHPEENIEKLENALTGCALDEENLRRAINKFLTQNETELFGINAESLILTIATAAQKPSA